MISWWPALCEKRIPGEVAAVLSEMGANLAHRDETSQAF